MKHLLLTICLTLLSGFLNAAPATVTAEWTPVPDAIGYRLYHEEALLTDQPGTFYETELDLADGVHSFSVEAYNQIGASGRRTVQREFAEQTAPGPVEEFDVRIVQRIVVVEPPPVGGVAENNLIGSSSAITHGQSFTLTADGIGFGTKPAQTPYLYDDGGGSSLATLYDDWEGTSIAYQNGGFRSVSLPNSRMAGMVVANRLNNGTLDNLLIKNFTPNSHPWPMYASFYYRMDPLWEDGTSGEGDTQIKPQTIGKFGQWDTPHIYTGIATNVNNGEDFSTAEWNYGGLKAGKWPVTHPEYTWGDAVATNRIKHWVRTETEFQISPSAGWYTVWELSVARAFTEMLVQNDIKTNDNAWDDPPGSDNHYFMFGGYVRDYGADNWSYFTDLFLDRGHQRVILGDANTYAGCKYHEPQPYTAWSSGSITLDINLGGLPTGTVYMYFVDDTGVVGGPLALTAS